MTLPTSGPLTLANIQTEFGGANPISLSEYYAGGAYVPSGTTGTYGAVPTSGTISIRNFYGTGGAVVNFVDQSVYSGTSSPATAGYRVNSDGFDYENVQNVYSVLSQWVTPTSAGGNYEVFATITSGSLTTGTTGSWIATSTNPTWTRSNGVVGTLAQVVLSLQVRATGTLTVLDTWTVTIDAERF